MNFCKKYYLEKEEKRGGLLSFPDDLESIRRTLILLLSYDKDIIKFMTRDIPRWYRESKNEVLPRIAFSLFLLSYGNLDETVSQIVKKKENIKGERERLDKNLEKSAEILRDSEKFNKTFEKWYKSDKRYRKRIWAALRDYLKLETLREEFIKGVEENKEVERIWRDKDLLQQLELPGDVWNNNPNFRENLLSNLLDLRNQRSPIAKIVRNMYEEIKNDLKVRGVNFHPEQLDITFDFVPRMCNKTLCDICIFALADNKERLEKICVKNENKYCPIVLVSCGYMSECRIQDCPLLDDNKNFNFCRKKR